MRPKVIKTIPSPNDRTGTMRGYKLKNGRSLANYARDWMERNKEAFFMIYDYVKHLQFTGCKGRLRDRVAVYCVEHNLSVGDDGYTFGNSYWAGIARYLVLYDGTLLDDPVKLNESDIDYFGLWPITYLEDIA